MARSGHSRANENREIKREELKRYLQERGKLQYVFDNLEKLENLKTQMDNVEVSRIKAATDTRVKLLNKYLPDLKQVEIDDSEKPNYSDLSDEELSIKIKELQNVVAASCAD